MERGLNSAEAARRLAQSGPNEIARAQGPSPVRILARQFRSALVGLLLAACVVCAALGQVPDAVAISAIVVLNAIVGFFQEYRAEAAIAALRSMTAPRARVRRDGRAAMVPAREVVPGDVLLLEAGDLVVADARLLEAYDLCTLEAPLTGESLPVSKRAEPAPADAPLAELHDRVFLGTSVATGTAEAEVLATGMRTELGKIAGLLAAVRDPVTPLQVRIAEVGRRLTWLCLGLVAVTAALGLARGQQGLEVLMTAVSLAVAAVPEGLAVFVTISLAVGVRRMAARNVLVRRLTAVETLGCTTVICTDKTGTLTTGVMAVRETWGPERHALLHAAAACCDAELDAAGTGGTGDPTELALLRAAAGAGIHRSDIERDRPRVLVRPFDGCRRRMAVGRADGVLYVKGAVEVVLPNCSTGVEGAAEANARMAGKGLRVLAVAAGMGYQESGLRLLGLVGLADPPRPEAIAAVQQARGAGIRTVMITGDHPATAHAIAQEMGLLEDGADPADHVHGRATAEDKLKIVASWKSKGHIVAMTGDGVNDAPALREAHIGIAMGRTGTEVTREAADMVLTDDNYASIVAAVREGRGIYENIRKTLVYLLAGNSGELALMLGAALVGLPPPLLPLQLLWINLVSDGLPALALSVDPAGPDALRRPPRRPNEPMLGRAQWRNILAVGLMEGSLVLAVFAWALTTRPEPAARDLCFTVLVFCELLRVFAARSATATFWELGVLSSPRLLAVVVLTILAQMAIHQVPAARALFHLGILPATDWLLCAGIGLVPVTVIETYKLLRR